MSERVYGTLYSQADKGTRKISSQIFLPCIPAQASDKYFTINLLILAHVDLGFLCKFLSFSVAVFVHVLHGVGVVIGVDGGGCWHAAQVVASADTQWCKEFYRQLLNKGFRIILQ